MVDGNESDLGVTQFGSLIESKPSETPDVLDVLIAGGGPAGTALGAGTQLWIGGQPLAVAGEAGAWKVLHHDPAEQLRGEHPVPEAGCFVDRSYEIAFDPEDHSITRRHARLVPDGAAPRACDRGAANGTRLRAANPTALHNGDEFRLAAHTLRLSGLALILCALAVGASSETAEPARQTRVTRWVEAHLEETLSLYRELHAAPELSFEEHATAARVETALRKAGFQVTAGLGQTGVVGLLRNGDGPTLMIRGDMDALPVTEETGLDYQSRVRTRRPDGSEVGVMHACGHDIHTANLIATARLLAENRDLWSGTLLAVAQPAEEIGEGALALLDEGLFERFPMPDTTLALHVESSLAAGAIGLTAGWAFANVDAVDVVLYGRGGHGARPQNASDPIVTASYFVTALQTLVSRRVDPQEAAVVTVGSFHAGHKRNVIPNEARLELTVRSYTDAVRKLLLDGIRQIAVDTCATWQCPKPPSISVRENYTPAVFNDPALTDRARALFEGRFGSAAVTLHPASMGGEDFGRYGRALGVPSLLFRVGAQDPALLAGDEPPPSLHSSRFAPVPEPTLRTALTALASLAIDLLQPEAAH